MRSHQASSHQSIPAQARGFSLMELMVAVAILAILASLSLGHVSDHRRLEVDAAARRLGLGLERARLSARRLRRPCGLSLSAQGWQAPLSGALPACSAAGFPLREASMASPISLQSNLPDVVRFTANGLVIDAGLVVLGRPGNAYRRCLVISLPLGITRFGRYSGDASAADPELDPEADPAAGLSSSACLPDERH
ncbi:MAG: type II secretion system protein [Prochlorococcus sp.]